MLLNADSDESIALTSYFLIIKLLQQQRHTGMDCRYPDSMVVMFTYLPWYMDSGNPCRNDEPFTLADESC